MISFSQVTSKQQSPHTQQHRRDNPMLLPNVIPISLLFLILFVDWTRGFYVSSSIGTSRHQLLSSSRTHYFTNKYNYRSSTEIDAKKKEDHDDGVTDRTNNKKNKGLIFIAPFVFLFGLDLVLNIAVITKRSLEVLFTGEYTVWTPWQ
jgi:hypothetical protein